MKVPSLNPLSSGAMFLTRRRASWRTTPSPSLNPLSSGAMFLTRPVRPAKQPRQWCLNPLSSGAMFLTRRMCARNPHSCESQSPIKRGNVSDKTPLARPASGVSTRSQSPIKRGNVSDPKAKVAPSGRGVSRLNPLSSGAMFLTRKKWEF